MGYQQTDEDLIAAAARGSRELSNQMVHTKYNILAQDKGAAFRDRPGAAIRLNIIGALEQSKC